MARISHLDKFQKICTYLQTKSGEMPCSCLKPECGISYSKQWVQRQRRDIKGFALAEKEAALIQKRRQATTKHIAPKAASDCEKKSSKRLFRITIATIVIVYITHIYLMSK